MKHGQLQEHRTRECQRFCLQSQNSINIYFCLLPLLAVFCWLLPRFCIVGHAAICYFFNERDIYFLYCIVARVAHGS